MLWAGLTLDLDWRSATLFEPPLVLPEQVADEADRHAARVSGTLRRRARWRSPEELAARLGDTAGFALLDAPALASVARAILRPAGEGGGFALRCAPATEAAIYQTMWDDTAYRTLRPFGVPVRFVASDASPPAPPSPARRAQRGAAAACGAAFTEMEGCSHLLAMERPEGCAALIRQTAAEAAHGGRRSAV
jgi:pimeloyl-ACP methyl ester carboxylesterase